MHGQDGEKGTDKRGRTVKLQSFDVLYIPGIGFGEVVGYSPIAMTKNAIELANAMVEYGFKFFANGTDPSGGRENYRSI